MEFAPIQEFPLHLVAGFESDRRSDGHGKGDIEAWSLSAGTDGLDAEGVGDGHGTFWGARLFWIGHDEE